MFECKNINIILAIVERTKGECKKYFKFFTWRNFHLAKFSLGEIFTWRNFHLAKFSLGEIFHLSNSREHLKHIGQPGREYTHLGHMFVVLQYEHFHFPKCSLYKSSAPQFSHVHLSTSAPICLKFITF